MIKLEQAKKLIMLARNAISVYFKGKELTVNDEIKKDQHQKNNNLLCVDHDMCVCYSLHSSVHHHRN